MSSILTYARLYVEERERDSLNQLKPFMIQHFGGTISSVESAAEMSALPIELTRKHCQNRSNPTALQGNQKHLEKETHEVTSQGFIKTGHVQIQNKKYLKYALISMQATEQIPCTTRPCQLQSQALPWIVLFRVCWWCWWYSWRCLRW